MILYRLLTLCNDISNDGNMSEIADVPNYKSTTLAGLNWVVV
jgi:hypothetical protein